MTKIIIVFMSYVLIGSIMDNFLLIKEPVLYAVVFWFHGFLSGLIK
jgi:hypothetical protein